jgi:putative chitinase
VPRSNLELPRWPDDTSDIPAGINPDGILGGIDLSSMPSGADSLNLLMDPADIGGHVAERSSRVSPPGGGFYMGLTPYRPQQEVTMGGIAVPPLLPSGMALIPADQLRAIMPSEKASDIEAAQMPLAIAMANHGISLPSQQAAFLGQVAVEGGLPGRVEDLSYTTAGRLGRVYGRRLFPSTVAEEHYLGRPQDLANYVYDGKNGNVPGTDDGWRYRGRGPMQVTGRANYRAVGFEDNPEALETPYGGAQGSAGWWENNGLPARTASELDRPAFDRLTRKINKAARDADTRWEAYQRALDALGR